jgi:hypothetical protein
MMKAGL